MWTTSMLKILTWILSSGPLGKGKHNMLNAQFAACFKCVTTLNIQLQELTIHKHYFTATTYCLSFLFSYEIERISVYLCIYMYCENFSENEKSKATTFTSKLCADIDSFFAIILYGNWIGLKWPLALKISKQKLAVGLE